MHDVVCGADDAFCFTVLLRDMRARHAKVYAMLLERVQERVVELLTIVTLKSFEGGGELGRDIGVKMRQSSKNVRFKA